MTDPHVGPLVMWTIYEHPRDHPDSYVVRGHEILVGATRPHAQPLAIVGTLEEARAALPGGLTRVARSPTDEAQIVESWF